VPTSDVLTDRVTLDFLLVADGAQAIGGKLYVLGGGWSHLLLPAIPGGPPVPFAIAIAMNVPWTQTNRDFNFALDIRDADGQRIGDGPLAQGQFQQGRPPGLRPGTSQRVMITITPSIEFPAAGRYSFHVLLDDEELGDTAIEVSPLPPGVATQGG
jgi:hypothetical protein